MEQSDVSSVDGGLSKLEDEIRRVEEEIAVVKKLDPLERKKETEDKNDLEFLRKEEELLRKEKELREKELLLLRNGEAASQSGELASALENLSLRPSVVKISWGRPKAASNFALSAQNLESLNLILCLSPAGFWQPPSPHLAEDVDEIRRVFGALCGCESYSQIRLEGIFS
jgi:hypothetical protein